MRSWVHPSDTLTKLQLEHGVGDQKVTLLTETEKQVPVTVRRADAMLTNDVGPRE